MEWYIFDVNPRRLSNRNEPFVRVALDIRRSLSSNGFTNEQALTEAHIIATLNCSHV